MRASYARSRLNLQMMKMTGSIHPPELPESPQRVASSTLKYYGIEQRCLGNRGPLLFAQYSTIGTHLLLRLIGKAEFHRAWRGEPDIATASIGSNKHTLFTR